jgi:hypothetical protein
MGQHGGNGSLNERCRELPKGLIGGVGPLQCRQGNQLTKSRAKAQQNCARGFVREKLEERQPVLRVQGATSGCHDAFGTSMVRGGHKHPGFFRGRHHGDGRQCGDSSGGVGWSISLVVKEERSPEGSTSWSRSFV